MANNIFEQFDEYKYKNRISEMLMALQSQKMKVDQEMSIMEMIVKQK